MAKALLIQPQVTQMIKFAPREPALDGPVDDRLERVPVQPEQLFSLGQAAAGQKHVDREALEE